LEAALQAPAPSLAFRRGLFAGLVTATIGKTGAAYMQDLGQKSLFIDENTVQPRSLAAELQAGGYPLPANTVNNYSGADAVTLAASNGSPTARAPYSWLC